MKLVILAGGYGTRLAEETAVRPKPMVEIGGMPILWHIMKIYLSHGVDEVIVCCGYKGYMIKQYFANYGLHSSDVTFDMKNHVTHIHNKRSEPWKVTLVDTGEGTLTGGRLRRVREYIGKERFCFTYGDGVADVNITELIKFHESQKVLVTLTATRPPGRFGGITLRHGQHKIDSFREKPDGDGSWINGGYFVVEPEAIDEISGDSTTWEREPLENLAARGQLAAYQHTGFWQPMDTLRDMHYLQGLWDSGKAPWKVWD
ncbi:MAG: glucose-1-phosphate cytidylyltransferase [Panacagrimonas sp.]